MAWKFAVPMAVMLLVSNLMAQSAEMADTNKASTKIGQFMSGNSVLKEKQEFKLGKIGGTGKVELYAVKSYRPGQGDTLRGIKFVVTESGQYGSTDIALLDIEEVQDLIEALKYLVEMSSNQANNVGKDFARSAFFTSRDNLTVGYDPTGSSLLANGFCSAGRFDRSTMYMTEDNYEKMITMVTDGLLILGTK